MAVLFRNQEHKYALRRRELSCLTKLYSVEKIYRKKSYRQHKKKKLDAIFINRSSSIYQYSNMGPDELQDKLLHLYTIPDYSLREVKEGSKANATAEWHLSYLQVYSRNYATNIGRISHGRTCSTHISTCIHVN